MKQHGKRKICISKSSKIPSRRIIGNSDPEEPEMYTLQNLFSGTYR